ncbi:MAG TPA: discoidin domain-containing protein [Candidatus Hydrogenedentes bacterium]|nr:discoidin domain-containing protein [Candidatus Hydrogenedentota bacterium]HPG65277.1 discoidin domain-containing protein [Candidatus Hydrogenedentota bacterium]
MVISALSMAFLAAAAVVHTPSEIVASSDSGDKYAPVRAADSNRNTRWASANYAALPQWIEFRFAEPVSLDTVILDMPVDTLYSPWKDVDLEFSSGDPISKSIEPDQTHAVFRFEPRSTQRVRAVIHSVHADRNYVGLVEVIFASDPDGGLWKAICNRTRLAKGEIIARGRADHPCVTVTPDDIREAQRRIERYDWAKKERDRIIADADEWLCESDAYWLQFLPKPGACYAYGRTGCPICGGSFGTWHGARCSWDKPFKATCSNGHILPNDEYPDDGTGYCGPDGRIFLPIGVWNAWVTEQWTQNALPALSEAYLLTGDERYASRATLLLDALASIYPESTSGSWDYPSDPPSGRLCRPWYQVARTLVLYADYFDFLFHSPAMDAPSLRQPEADGARLTRRENIERNLLLDGAYYCYSHTFDARLTNGHADYMRGALAVGCVLDAPAYVLNAVEGPFSIHTMLANNTDRDGRYYETSISYALHARNLYLTFAMPLRNLRSAEYPNGINLYDDARFQSCMLLPDLQSQLAGRMPNFGDMAPDTGYRPWPKQPFSDNDYRYLEHLCAGVSDVTKRAEFARALRWLADGDLDALRAAAPMGSWLLWHAADVHDGDATLPSGLDARVYGSWVAGMKGIAFVRRDQQAALLRYGPSLTHGDLDDMGLLYYANGYELSYDIGYGFGSTHVQCGWGSQTVSHCLVTVDETSQCVGSTPTSGGSLEFFAELPSAMVMQADSARSYASLGVTEYRRTTALVNTGGYLFDVFRVTGGHRHDYGWGSLGTDLEPFGVDGIEAREGSLAEGVAWGEKILPEGDIEGYPNKPYWNPPPGNGYGFFYHVRQGTPEADAEWGGTWAIDGPAPARFRAHLCGDPATAVFADAPGLYPSYSNASYILARRSAEGDAPLESTFVAVYEPFAGQALHYDFDYRDLAQNLLESSVPKEIKDSLGVIYLRGTQVGDSMTFRVHLDAEKPPMLNMHSYKSPIYATIQVEWDGAPVGDPVGLTQRDISGPDMSPIGVVDASPGDHTVTFRIAEGEGLHLGLAGISFGETHAVPPEPIIESVRRLGQGGAEVRRVNGTVDLLLSGKYEGISAYGDVVFDGDFAFVSGDGEAIATVETLGCNTLTIAGNAYAAGPAAFVAHVLAVDLDARMVTLDAPLPDGLDNRVAVFSHPDWAVSSAYHVARAEADRLYLHASTLCIGCGRVSAVNDANCVVSDVPHEYLGAHGCGFVDGKRLRADSGFETRIARTEPTAPLKIYVDDASGLSPGTAFDYIDLSPGDEVRISLIAAR